MTNEARKLMAACCAFGLFVGASALAGGVDSLWGGPVVAVADELQYPLFEPGQGPRPDPRRHLFFMTGHLAILYGYKEGKLPASVEELRPYLFFLPVPYFTQWKLSRDGDLLYIEAIVSETVEPKMYRKAINRPGSALAMESELAARNSVAKMYRRNPSEFPRGVTEEDILSGRRSSSPIDMMQSYARNEGEFLQLYQSFILAHLLMPALSGYAVEHGAYPDRLEDAFGPLGRVNEEAWRSVLTGEPMVIGERKSSTCIFYERTEDGNHYELYVPLFGAGAEKPLGLNQSEFRREEYCAGKYFRYTSKTTYSYAL